MPQVGGAGESTSLLPRTDTKKHFSLNMVQLHGVEYSPEYREVCTSAMS